MKAMLVNENGTPVWTEVENPVIKSEELLVKIYAVGVNRADLLQRQGKYPSPEGCPPWMGLEISGEVVEIGHEAAKKAIIKSVIRFAHYLVEADMPNMLPLSMIC